jgi:hypothetical protein
MFSLYAAMSVFSLFVCLSAFLSGFLGDCLFVYMYVRMSVCDGAAKSTPATGAQPLVETSRLCHNLEVYTVIILY